MGLSKEGDSAFEEAWDRRYAEAMEVKRLQREQKAQPVGDAALEPEVEITPVEELPTTLF